MKELAQKMARCFNVLVLEEKHYAGKPSKGLYTNYRVLVGGAGEIEQLSSILEEKMGKGTFSVNKQFIPTG